MKIIVRILINAIALAVTVYDQVAQVIAGWRWLDLPWIPRDLLRSFSQNAGALLLLFVGTLAALRARLATADFSAAQARCPNRLPVSRLMREAAEKLA